MALVNGSGPLGVLETIPTLPSRFPGQMSEQIYSYACNEGAQNEQARKRQKRAAAREWREHTCAKAGLRVSTHAGCLSHVRNIPGIL